MTRQRTANAATDNAQVQSAGFVLELTPDWLIQRASENVRGFLGEYPQRLIGEPLSNFTLAQPLHDLRNSLSRQRGASGIARCYRVRLIDEPRHFDLAFQLLDATIVLEGLPSPHQGIGEALGSVSRLIEGLHVSDRKAMLEGATRRMRALTGFDRVVLTLSGEIVESSRSQFAELSVTGELPAMIADSGCEAVPLFPRRKDDDEIEHALLRSPSNEQLRALRDAGVSSTLSVPIVRDGKRLGLFRCDNRIVCEPSFELHAAAELFAQVFAMQLPG